MSEAPILKDTTRSSGREALQKNIQAAMALAEAIRSTLGPKGLDKLLIDDEGRTLVTNDGVTVLETAKVEHPVAKMMINASSTQDRIAKDGTTSTVILAGEMLQNAWQLILQGIHPSTIARGFRKSEQYLLQCIADIAFESDRDMRHTVVKTALAGKGHSSMQEIVAKLSLEAVEMVADEDSSVDLSKIKLISQTGGIVEDCIVLRGLMLPKKRISSNMKKEIIGGKIVLIDGGLEKKNVSSDLKLNVTTTGIFESFRQEERKMLKQQVDQLVSHKISVLACRESIDDEIRNYLAEHGIQAFRRVARSDLNMLAKVCNARTVGSVGDLTDDDVVVCGGGASYVALARRLRRYAETIPGREQLAVEAYADAIEVIVRVLAENAGIDPISALLDVVAEQTNADSNNIGINLQTGRPDDMLSHGILEPKGVVRQAIIGATEVAISILRIDDVLWAKQQMEMPELPDDEM